MRNGEPAAALRRPDTRRVSSSAAPPAPIAPLGPQKARPVVLDEAWTAGAALAHIAQACVAHMQANEAGVLAGRDPEYLHQFRVALRRLRSCLRLARDGALRPLRAELRWLQSALAGARDWDVFMMQTIAPLARSQRKDVVAFRARCAALGRAHRRRARAAIRSARYAALLQGLRETFAGYGQQGQATDLALPAREFAAAMLDVHDRRLRKRGADVPKASPQTRHETRIAAKRLRYAAEFFGSLYPAAQVQRYVKALQALQDTLGVLNDAAVIDGLLAEVGTVPQYVDAWVRGWVAAVTERELSHYAAAWRRFSEAPLYWHLYEEK